MLVTAEQLCRTQSAGSASLKKIQLPAADILFIFRFDWIFLLENPMWQLHLFKLNCLENNMWPCVYSLHQKLFWVKITF